MYSALDFTCYTKYIWIKRNVMLFHVTIYIYNKFNLNRSRLISTFKQTFKHLTIRIYNFHFFLSKNLSSKLLLYFRRHLQPLEFKVMAKEQVGHPPWRCNRITKRSNQVNTQWNLGSTSYTTLTTTNKSHTHTHTVLPRLGRVVAKRHYLAYRQNDPRDHK